MMRLARTPISRRPLRPISLALAGLALGWMPVAEAFQAGSTDPAPALGELGRSIAAYGRDSSITFEELEDLLIWRHGLGEEGRSALRELLDLGTLAELAKEQSLTISPKDVKRRWDELEKEVLASGEAQSLKEYLGKNRVDPQVFRRYLELSIVHETLARKDLGIPAKDPITGEQQSMWLQGILSGRQYEELPHPYADGIVARSGSITITRNEFAAQLLQKLSDEILEEACFQLLLEKRVLARMPDLSEEAIEKAVGREIARRRAEAEGNPDFKGLDYESLLGAQGLTLEGVRQDPAIRVAALTHFWLERSHSDEDLRDAYKAERSTFDGLYGEGIEVNVLLLKAARFKNELNPRTFEDADSELEELRARVQGVEDFQRLVRLHSEDPLSREKGGLLGVVTRGTPRVPEQIRKTVFRELDASKDPLNGRVLGPIRVQGASALLCLGQRRRAPVWAEMKFYVQTEKRRRFLDEQLLQQEVTTWLR